MSFHAGLTLITMVYILLQNLMNLAEMLGDVKNKGLSKTDLGRLPVVSYKKTEGQEIEECNICMTDYEEGDSQKILPCFHSFHCICIDKWIKVQSVNYI